MSSLTVQCPNCGGPAWVEVFERIDPQSGRRWRVRQINCSSRKKRYTARKASVVYEGCGPNKTEEEIT